MSGVLNLLLAGAASAIKDAYYNLTTLLLNTSSTNGAQNNTFLDSSTNNFTITRNGNTTQGTFTPFSQTGWSNYFNGSSNLATVANPNLAFGTGDVTCEFWMNTFNNSDNGLFGTTNEAAWNSNSWSFKYSASAIVLYNGNNGGDLWSISTGTLHDGAWHHVAIVRNSGTWQVFVDGISKGTTTTQGTRSLGDNSWRFAVGSIEPSNADLKYTGYLSNFRLNNTAVYSSNFTPSTTPLSAITGTKLLTCQSNRFLDNSTSAIAFTVGSAPSVQAFSPFAPTAEYSTSVVGGSGYFDGTGDWLTAPNNTAFDFGSGNFTIEAWYYPTVTSPNSGLFGKRANGSVYGPFVVEFASSLAPTFYFSTTGSSWNSINSSVSCLANSWNHIAATRSGSTFTIWINGVSGGTASTASALMTNTDAVSIGAVAADGTRSVTGYLSGSRLIKGTAQYTTTFTPPTAPPTAITNTSLLLNYTNSGIFDSTAKNVLETVGNAQVSTTQAKWGTTSMYFDGSGDYLKPYYPAPANGTTFSFGTGDFTVEFWMYPTSAPSNGMIMDGRGSGASGDMWLINWVNGVLSWYAGSSLISSSTVSTNTWTHVAICRSGTSTKMFLNGTQTGSTYTDTKNYTVGNGWVTIGASFDAAEFFTGYLDDLRITKYARYTTNFTAPAAAFALQ